VLVFEGGRWRKDDELFAGIESATFETLVLPPELAGELREDVTRFFASREAYERYGVAWRRGLLFTGPPGNGKTHTVKAIVNLCGVSCLYVRGLKSYFDSVDANIHAVFDRARRAAPCLLVFEDLDSLVDKKSRSTFLNELDGFAPNAGVLTLATSNYPEKIDAALVDRPGRFDRTFVFELPADAERREYVELWNAALAPEARASVAGVSAAARAAEGFSFAMLKELLVTSMTEWFQSDGARAMDDVLASRAAALRPRKAKRKKRKKK
jgi:SpoVK/Ycf46/Vps4 family AAA+-type ATPase